MGESVRKLESQIERVIRSIKDSVARKWGVEKRTAPRGGPAQCVIVVVLVVVVVVVVLVVVAAAEAWLTYSSCMHNS